MIKQNLSALLDGELSAEEMRNTLDALLNDTQMQHSWRCQHLIRDAIRDKEIVDSLTIADRVSAALENEPVIFASANLASQHESLDIKSKGTNNVVKMPSKRLNVLAYAAMAASIAAIVVVSFLPGKSSVPMLAGSTQGNAPASLAVEQELQSMVVQHGEFSGAAALNGLVAYAKVVNGSLDISR